MTTDGLLSLIRDPMLLPPREEPYRLQSVHELLDEGFREELVLGWGDSYLVVRVDADWDTLTAEFLPRAFTPTEAYRDLGACAPWDRLIGKVCDWTWVGVNQQGYSDLIVFSFDAILPQILLHAIASSIEIFTVSGHDLARRMAVNSDNQPE